MTALARWSYDEAFCRHRGLLSSAEQATLRRARVAVAGLGGVGGADLVALARLGIGRFTIADGDVFEVKNTNRQYGAMSSTAGKSKAEVMAALVRDINPEVELTVLAEPLGPGNLDAFLDGADVVVDALDAFEIGLRQQLFAKARARGLFALGAGPVGFSTVWVIIDPKGLSFDEYFDLRPGQDELERVVAYLAGMTPAATQRSYLDLSALDVEGRAGPSVGLACHLASGVVAAEVLKLLLGRGPVRAAPVYHQFDAYLGRLVVRRLWWGNRNPLQRLKRAWLVRHLRQRLAVASPTPVDERSRTCLP